MMEWGSTHSNINLKTFDIVMTPAFGAANIPITIYINSEKKKRKNQKHL